MKSILQTFLERTLGLWLVIALVTGASPSVASVAAVTVKRGPVTATVSLSNDSISIGDSLEISVEVRAANQVEVLLPQFGQSLERFPILDFVPESRIEADGSSVHTQRYRVAPNQSGKQHVPSLMIEFVDRRPGERPAPEGEDAFELITERVPFEVLSVLPESTTLDLHPALGSIERVQFSPQASFGLGLAVVALAATGIFALWWLRRTKQVSAPDAYAQATTRLGSLKAKGAPNEKDMEAFFIELSSIVRVYVEGRFGLHAPELTTEEFIESAADSPDLTDSQRQFLREFLSGADAVKFAKHRPSRNAAEAAINAVTSFLEDTHPINQPDEPIRVPQDA